MGRIAGHNPRSGLSKLQNLRVTPPGRREGNYGEPLAEFSRTRSPAALNEVAICYGESLIRFSTLILKRFGSPKELSAEDIVQSLYCEFLKNGVGFDEQRDTNPTTFLFRCCQNRIIQRTRHLKHWASLDALAQNEKDYILPYSREGDPAKVVEARDEVESVLDKIMTLPERQRNVVHAFAIDELTYEETAAALGVKMGTVKSTLFHARETLVKLAGIAVGRAIPIRMLPSKSFSALATSFRREDSRN